MNRDRLLICASGSAQVAEFINLGWSMTRWMDARVEAYTADVVHAAAQFDRHGRAVPGDLAIVEKPGDPVALSRLVAGFAAADRRALLLPPRGATALWSLSGWESDPSGSAETHSEAALLAIAVEQHMRWGGSAPLGYIGDPISVQAIEAVLDGAHPTWPQPPGWMWSGMYDSMRLHTVALPADGMPSLDRGTDPDIGIILIPSRPAYRISAALDAGMIVVQPAGQPAPTTDLIQVRMTCHPERLGRATIGFGAGEEPAPGEVVVSVLTPSLLDPHFHHVWVALRELLAMPRLRSGLVAAQDAESIWSTLVLHEMDLDDTDQPMCSQER